MPGLFDQFTIRNLTLKNRIVMAPMSTRMATDRGEVTDRHIVHYTKRATANIGLIIVEYAFVQETGRTVKHQLSISNDDLIPGLSRLAKAIREAGASPAIQICHGGPRREPGVLEEQPLSPSGVRITKDWGIWEMPQHPRPMTTDEMEEVIADFAASARRAVNAGFDAVEIHGAHGMLLSQFLSPLTNLRDDNYGGDVNRRVAFPCEVALAVRKSIGNSFPFFYRLGANDFLPGGLTAEEGQQAAKALVEAGVDVVDVSGGLGGGGEDMQTTQGYFVPLAEGVRRAIDAPVVCAGNIRDPEYADQVVREERIDLVGIGRGLLSEPLWANRAAERLGVKVER